MLAPLPRCAITRPPPSCGTSSAATDVLVREAVEAVPPHASRPRARPAAAGAARPRAGGGGTRCRSRRPGARPGPRRAVVSSVAIWAGRCSGANGTSARSSASNASSTSCGAIVVRPAVDDAVADGTCSRPTAGEAVQRRRRARRTVPSPTTSHRARVGQRPRCHARSATYERVLERGRPAVQAGRPGPVADLGHVLEVLDHVLRGAGRACSWQWAASDLAALDGPARPTAAPRGTGGSGSSRSAPPCRTASWWCPPRCSPRTWKRSAPVRPWMSWWMARG